MPISIVIQYREDDPWNSGWWRMGRPVHEVRGEAPEICDSQWWYYGSADDAVAAAAAWDLQNPRG
jgi:hypothetical protein